MRIRFAALFALLALLAAACGEAVAGDPLVAAVVGDEEIPIAAVERRFESAKANPQVAQQLEGDTEGQFAQQIQAQILTQLIRSQLLAQGAQELGVQVTDEDVEAKREEIVEELGGEEEFERIVEENNLTQDEVREQLRDLALQDQVQEALAEDIDIDDAELREAFENDPQGRFGERRQARHILVQTEQEAQQALARVRAGEDFATVAEEVSQDTGSAQQGGDLGEFGRGQMVPAFEEAVFGADVGELVGPVQTDFGYHVIEVTGVTEPPTFSEAREDLRAELLEERRMNALRDFLTEQQQDADITVNPRFGTWDAEQGQVVPVDPLGELRDQAPETGEQELELPGGAPGGAPGEAGAPGQTQEQPEVIEPEQATS